MTLVLVIMMMVVVFVDNVLEILIFRFRSGIVSDDFVVMCLIMFLILCFWFCE
jgi:hypothetical protein